MAVSVHEARIHRIALGVNGFLSDIMAHNHVLIANSDKLSVFHGKSLSLGEVIVNGIDVGVVDDEIHGRFWVA